MAPWTVDISSNDGDCSGSQNLYYTHQLKTILCLILILWFGRNRFSDIRHSDTVVIQQSFDNSAQEFRKLQF